jgi:hypothetical protein
MKSDGEVRAVERLVALALSGCVSLLILLLCASARAETLQAPWGGKPIPLGEARVPCSSPGGGWVFDDKTRALVPPASAEAVAKGLGFDPAPTSHLAVVHCPMSIASVPPLRDVENVRLVVRIEGRCATELPELRFSIGSTPADVLSIQTDSTGAEALLRVGITDAPSLSITAVHRDSPGVAVAVAHVDTAAAPAVSAELEIDGHPNLSFIPNNRPAVVHARTLPAHAHLVPLEVPGAYSVARRGALFTVLGDVNTSGQAALRFGYRDDSLSGDFANADLAVLTSPVQRSIHEANVMAPFGRSAMGPHPLAELVCGGGLGGTVRVMPGVQAHLPFDLRDSCRVIFHRERLSREFGTQKLAHDILAHDACQVLEIGPHRDGGMFAVGDRLTRSQSTEPLEGCAAVP